MIFGTGSNSIIAGASSFDRHFFEIKEYNGLLKSETTKYEYCSHFFISDWLKLLLADWLIDWSIESIIVFFFVNWIILNVCLEFSLFYSSFHYYLTLSYYSNLRRNVSLQPALPGREISFSINWFFECTGCSCRSLSLLSPHNFFLPYQQYPIDLQ